MNRDALFISYDGLLDPLGGSQILPYIRAIAAHPRHVHVLSFEKPARYAAGAAALRARLASEGIGWSPVSFSRGGKLRKAWDLARMYATATRLMRRRRFGIVHCRSYQACEVGCFLKRWFGCKVVFDMRGLWVDERIDGGLWSLRRRADRLAYRHYKRVERRLLACADHIVVLTRRVLPELRRLSAHIGAPVTVIPCCADFGHFRPPTRDQRDAARAAAGIDAAAFVVGYLGSIGTWYMFDDMARFFTEVARARSDAQLLVVTHDWRAEYLDKFRVPGIGDFTARVHVVSASREEVPRWLGAMDVLLSFIKPAFSKRASSPTKLAEAWACGVPVICNPGVGDVDENVRDLQAGTLVDPAVAGDVSGAIARLDALRATGGAALRARAEPLFDLPVAADAYRRVYLQLEAM